MFGFGLWFRRDPGPCPICGAAHTACTGMGPAVELTNARQDGVTVALEEPPTMPDGTFTTATYDRKKHGVLRGASR